MEVSISERSFVIMKLIPVDAIPKMGGYHKLQDLIEEFCLLYTSDAADEL